MQNYLDTKKHDTVLLGAVDRHIQMLPNDRNALVIHPSEMCKPDWCPRATWHRLLGHAQKEQPAVPLKLSLIFETGTRSGEKWQQWTKDMGILWGRWVCRLCEQERFEWSSELGGNCSALLFPGPHYWRYCEVPLVHGKIAGHADGIVNPTGDESLIMENKTIGPGTLRLLDLVPADHSDDTAHGMFGKITKILPSHFYQTQIYLRMAQSLTEVVGPIQRGVVVYEYKADQQVREFVIEYDPRWTDHLWEVAADIEWAISKDREIKCPRGGCAQCHAYEGEH